MKNNKNNKNSKVRGLLVLGLALVLSLSLSATAFGAASISTNEAINKALKNAKLTKSKVVALEAEYDDGKYEIEFIKSSNGAEYSFEYSKSGKLLEKSVDYNRTPNYGAKKLSKTQARNKVASFGGFKKATVNKGSCVYTRDDGQKVYEIHFNTTNYRYEYEVHARTGKIMEYSKEARTW